MIYLVQRVETMAPVNKKAKDICKFCSDYEGCLLTSKADFDDLIKTIKKTVEYTNGLYPRTKPFRVTTNHDNYIHIEVEGGLGTSVVRFQVLTCDNLIQFVLLTLLFICLPLEQKNGNF